MSLSTYGAVELNDTALTVEATKARQNFRELVDAAMSNRTRIIVTRNGKPMAAIVSLRDLDHLRAGDAAIDRRMMRNVDATEDDWVPFDEFHTQASSDAAGRDEHAVRVGTSIDEEALALGDMFGRIAAGIFAAAVQQAVASGVRLEAVAGEELSDSIMHNLMEVIRDPDKVSQVTRDAAIHMTSRAG